MKLSVILSILLFYQILFCLNGINNLYSQETNSVKFQIDGNIRYRYEKWNGMNMLNYGDDSPNSLGNLNDNILLQRVILITNHRKILLFLFIFRIPVHSVGH